MDLIVWERTCEYIFYAWRNYQFKKKKVLTNYISFESETGLRAYAHNDFVLKVPYGEPLLNIGDFVVPEGTEFGGKILERIIDTDKEIVEYTGITLRGWLDTMMYNTSGVYTGTSAEIYNNRNGYVDEHIKAFTDDETTRQMSYASTSGLIFASHLYLLDKISTAFNQKFKIKLADGILRIDFYPKNEQFYDSSFVNVVIDENDLSPNLLYGYYFVDGQKVFNGTVVAALDENGKATSDQSEWAIIPEDEVITVIAEVEGSNYAEALPNAVNKLDELQVKNTSEIKVDVNEGDVGDIVTASVAELGYRESKRISVIELTLKNGIPEYKYRLEE